MNQIRHRKRNILSGFKTKETKSTVNILWFHSFRVVFIKKKNVKGFIKQIYEPLIGNSYINKLVSNANASKVEAKYIPEYIIVKELDLLQKQ